MPTIREIHDALNKKKVSSVELTRAYLAAIRASKNGEFLTLCEERALQQAESADQLLRSEGKVPQSDKPLLGIPIGIKDVLTIEGVRTTCGSKILENYISPYTATAIQRLELAGAVILGKQNMDEFAMGGSNENSAFGPVRHPTHPDRVPGGSSGGSAAAVRAGLCHASIGTDTGGSIRLPASYCGVVGIKPSYGRISRYGLVAFASSLDQIGPLAQSVEDAALLLDVMSGHDPLDSTSWLDEPGRGSGSGPRLQAYKASQTLPDWRQLRIGVPQEYFSGGLSSDVEQSIQKSLKWFESQGARLIPITLPHSQYAVSVYYVVAVCEASSNLARFDGVRFGVRPPAALEAKDLNDFYQKVRANFGAEVKRRIILGTFALSSGYSESYYKKACQVRRKIKQDFDRAFQEVDLIVGPVSPSTAFKAGEKLSDPLQMYLNDLFTIPANLAGLPAMSLPCGEDREGLPMGLHLMAPPFAEERMISVAQAFFTGFEPKSKKENF